MMRIRLLALILFLLPLLTVACQLLAPEEGATPTLMTTEEPVSPEEAEPASATPPAAPAATDTVAAPTNTPRATFTPIRPPTMTPSPEGEEAEATPSATAGAEEEATAAATTSVTREATAAATEAATRAATRAATATTAAAAAATSTPVEEQEPLNFTYEVSWELSTEDSSVVLATFTIDATGGSGDYSYYHNNVLQPGATFTVQWGTCATQTGTIRVESAGRAVSDEYEAEPPCPGS